MKEEKTKTSKEVKHEKKTESKMEKKEEKVEPETKKEEETKDIKKEAEKKVKKYEAVAYGVSLPISKKQSTYISSFIKGKSIDQAIKELNEVLIYKRAIPFKGEIPHRKGKGMMSGRYPITASTYFINLLKSLKGNSIVAGLDLDKTRVYIASASFASRPKKSHGRLAKRANLILKAKEFNIGGKK